MLGRGQPHAYKARNGVHLPSGSHAHQQHSTDYDLDGSKSDGTWGILASVGAVQLVETTG